MDLSRTAGVSSPIWGMRLWWDKLKLICADTPLAGGMTMLMLKSWMNRKSWALAFVIATGAFWVTMLKDPPKTIAADPSTAFSVMDIKIPSGLPIAESGNTY